MKEVVDIFVKMEFMSFFSFPSLALPTHHAHTHTRAHAHSRTHMTETTQNISF